MKKQYISMKLMQENNNYTIQIMKFKILKITDSDSVYYSRFLNALELRRMTTPLFI